MSDALRDIGSLYWADQTAGRLRVSDKARILLKAISAQIRLALPARTASAVTVDEGLLSWPDTPLCGGALAFVEASHAPWLLNHCLRTYLWARILGLGHGLTHDPELLFLACVFHDLGLSEAGPALSPKPAECFAVEGAWGARRWLQEHQCPTARAELIAEAIALHTNIEVATTAGMEAHLLHEGAALDVVGSRYREVAANQRKAVLRDHPRLNMKRELTQCFRHEQRCRPDSRIPYMMDKGFARLLQNAPFEE